MNIGHPRQRRRPALTAGFFTIILLLGLSSCTAPSKFDFDDGTTQGWKHSVIHDDKNVFYYPPEFFTLSHFEGAQYPGSFPQGDNLTDKKGCLLLDGGQLSQQDLSKAGFPATSETWGVIASFTGLQNTSSWQNIKGVSAALGDNYAIEDGHLKATISVWVDDGTSMFEVYELDSSNQPVYHALKHGSWTQITSNLKVPSGGKVFQVSIHIIGDWKDYKVYEGGICIDEVTPIQ